MSFFRSHSLRIISSKRRNVDPNYRICRLQQGSEKNSWSFVYVPDCYERLQEMQYKDYSHVVTPEP